MHSKCGFKQTVKHTAWVLLFLLCLNLVNAAVISGSVYDLALQQESNVIIEINTTPKQLLVSQNGDYLFNVNLGLYTLYAHTDTAIANESIVITDNGTYILDLILEESLIELQDYSLAESDTGVSLNDISESSIKVGIIILIGFLLVLALFAIGLYLFIRTKAIKHELATKSDSHNIKHEDKHNEIKHQSIDSSEKPLDEYEHKVLQLVKKEKRTTQKDLRKEIPLSEAKISLIITDLESKGKIRKIKKGRGNILIFVKD